MAKTEGWRLDAAGVLRLPGRRSAGSDGGSASHSSFRLPNSLGDPGTASRRWSAAPRRRPPRRPRRRRSRRGGWEGARPVLIPTLQPSQPQVGAGPVLAAMERDGSSSSFRCVPPRGLALTQTLRANERRPVAVGLSGEGRYDERRGGEPRKRGVAGITLVAIGVDRPVLPTDQLAKPVRLTNLADALSSHQVLPSLTAGVCAVPPPVGRALNGKRPPGERALRGVMSDSPRTTTRLGRCKPPAPCERLAVVHESQVVDYALCAVGAIFLRHGNTFLAMREQEYEAEERAAGVDRRASGGSRRG